MGPRSQQGAGWSLAEVQQGSSAMAPHSQQGTVWPLADMQQGLSGEGPQVPHVHLDSQGGLQQCSSAALLSASTGTVGSRSWEGPQPAHRHEPLTDVRPLHAPVPLDTDYPSTGKVWQTLNIGESSRVPSNLIISGAVRGQITAHCLKWFAKHYQYYGNLNSDEVFCSVFCDQGQRNTAQQCDVISVLAV